jgi:hypothetical protein
LRREERQASVAVIIAVGVTSDGRREVLGMDIGPSEAFGEAAVHRTPAFSASSFWTELPHASAPAAACAA